MIDKLIAYFANYRIMTRLLAMALIPLLGLTFFAGQIALDRRSTAADANEIKTLAELSVGVGNLLHEHRKNAVRPRSICRRMAPSSAQSWTRNMR